MGEQDPTRRQTEMIIRNMHHTFESKPKIERNQIKEEQGRGYIGVGKRSREAGKPGLG